MTTLINDLKYSLRHLAQTPGFTLVAIVTLAVGIGVNAAVFGLIDGWMLRPLPGQRDGKLVRLFSRRDEPRGQYRSFSYPYFKALQEEDSPFSHLAAFSPCAQLLQQGGISRTAVGAFVSSNFFDTLGVSPALGRCFTAEESQPGRHEPVVMLSHRLWQRLGGDSHLLGKNLILNDMPTTMVGVLPASLISASQLTNKDLWLPLGMMGNLSKSKDPETTPRLYSHDFRPLMLIGQVRPGLNQAALSSQLDPIVTHLANIDPQAYGKLNVTTGPVGNFLMGHGPDQPIAVNKPLTALIVVSACTLIILASTPNRR